MTSPLFTLECPTCHGEGRLWYDRDERTRPCDTCAAAGEIPIVDGACGRCAGTRRVECPRTWEMERCPACRYVDGAIEQQCAEVAQ